MQGRPGRGNDEPWDKYASQRLEALSNTTKQRVVPQRPSNMAHVNEPPKKPRVGRPKREPASQMPPQRRLMLWGCGISTLALLAVAVFFIFLNVFNAMNASSGPAVTVANFLKAVGDSDYNNAYTYLSPVITLHVSPDQFSTQAKNDDSCYGKLKDYQLATNGTSYQENNQSYQYTYTITRIKLKQPYQIHLSLQQDPNAGNAWKITDYGGDLGPGNQSTSTCNAK